MELLNQIHHKGDFIVKSDLSIDAHILAYGKSFQNISLWTFLYSTVSDTPQIHPLGLTHAEQPERTVVAI